MSITQLISILIGFHIAYTVLVQKAKNSYDDTSKNREVTDSMSFSCKNDMWTVITKPCRFRSHNCIMPQVWKCRLAWSESCI